MISSAHRMGRMIDDMLDLARARLAGGIPLNRQPADLAALMHRVVHEHQENAPGRCIEVSIEGDVSGDWDTDRLAQVASNLIGNALRHGDGASPIEVRLQGSADRATLVVANGGIIPPDVLPHVFDPFRGGERRLGRGDGLGLGLYIVQQVVLAHHGRIAVHSTEGRTTFELVLPRRAFEVVKL
jgi:signal transduction histidine kinase